MDAPLACADLAEAIDEANRTGRASIYGTDKVRGVERCLSREYGIAVPLVIRVDGQNYHVYHSPHADYVRSAESDLIFRPPFHRLI